MTFVRFKQRPSINNFIDSSLPAFSSLYRDDFLTKGFQPSVPVNVFEKENEDLVRFVLENLPFTLHKSAYLKGYDKKSDTLFAAAFTAL